MISATKIGITRRNILWEGSYLALKLDTLRPFRTTCFFLLITQHMTYVKQYHWYNDTLGCTTRTVPASFYCTYYYNTTTFSTSNCLKNTTR